MDFEVLIYSSDFRVEGLGFRLKGLGFRVQGRWLRVQDLRLTRSTEHWSPQGPPEALHALAKLSSVSCLGLKGLFDGLPPLEVNRVLSLIL